MCRRAHHNSRAPSGAQHWPWPTDLVPQASAAQWVMRAHLWHAESVSRLFWRTTLPAHHPVTDHRALPWRLLPEPGFKPTASRLQVQRLNHSATPPSLPWPYCSFIQYEVGWTESVVTCTLLHHLHFFSPIICSFIQYLKEGQGQNNWYGMHSHGWGSYRVKFDSYRFTGFLRYGWRQTDSRTDTHRLLGLVYVM